LTLYYKYCILICGNLGCPRIDQGGQVRRKEPEKWASFGIIWDYKLDETTGLYKLYQLIQDSESLDPKYSQTIRPMYPGGTRNLPPKPEDEDPVTTFRREIREETGLIVGPSVKVDLVCYSRARLGRIQRYFYAVKFGDCTGNLRRGKYKIDGDQKLYPPRWEEVKDLHDVANLYRSHRCAFVEGYEHFKKLGFVG